MKRRAIRLVLAHGIFGRWLLRIKDVSPSAIYILAHTSQPKQVARHSVVVQVTPHHAIQPLAHDGYRLMPSAHQLRPDFGNLQTHSLLHRQSSNLKQALSGGSVGWRKGHHMGSVEQGHHRRHPAQSLQINGGGFIGYAGVLDTPTPQQPALFEINRV